MNLCVAAWTNDKSSATQLLSQGIHPDTRSPWSASRKTAVVVPLRSSAADAATPPALTPSAEAAIPSFANANGPVEDDVYDALPLCLAVIQGHVDMVRILLDAGAHSNRRDGRGRTALICAIFGHVDTLQITPANCQVVTKCTPVHLSLVQLLLQGLASNRQIFPEVVNQPQDAPFLRGITPLCLAAYLGKVEVVRALLAAGAEVDGRDKNGATALMYAARDGHAAVVKQLLDFGAAHDAVDANGWMAIQYGQASPQIIALLEQAAVKQKGIVNAFPNTVLAEIATKYPSFYLSLSAFLTSYSAKSDNASFNYVPGLSSGSQPLIAGKVGPIPHPPKVGISVSDLMRSTQTPATSPTQTPTNHHTLLTAIKHHELHTLQMVLQTSTSIHLNYIDPNTGLTPLQYATRTRPLKVVISETIVKMLVAQGADVNLQNPRSGKTALHYITRDPYFGQPVSMEMQPETDRGQPNIHPQISETVKAIIKFLLYAGADPNTPDFDGNRPLHFAAKSNDLVIVTLLVEEGHADLNVVSRKGKRPIDMCRSSMDGGDEQDWAVRRYLERKMMQQGYFVGIGGGEPELLSLMTPLSDNVSVDRRSASSGGTAYFSDNSIGAVGPGRNVQRERPSLQVARSTTVYGEHNFASGLPQQHAMHPVAPSTKRTSTAFSANSSMSSSSVSSFQLDEDVLEDVGSSNVGPRSALPSHSKPPLQPQTGSSSSSTLSVPASVDDMHTYYTKALNLVTNQLFAEQQRTLHLETLLQRHYDEECRRSNTYNEHLDRLHQYYESELDVMSAKLEKSLEEVSQWRSRCSEVERRLQNAEYMRDVARDAYDVAMWGLDPCRRDRRDGGGRGDDGSYHDGTRQDLSGGSTETRPSENVESIVLEGGQGDVTKDPGNNECDDDENEENVEHVVSDKKFLEALVDSQKKQIEELTIALARARSGIAEDQSESSESGDLEQSDPRRTDRNSTQFTSRHYLRRRSHLHHRGGKISKRRRHSKTSSSELVSISSRVPALVDIPAPLIPSESAQNIRRAQADLNLAILDYALQGVISDEVKTENNLLALKVRHNERLRQKEQGGDDEEAEDIDYSNAGVGTDREPEKGVDDDDGGEIVRLEKALSSFKTEKQLIQEHMWELLGQTDTMQRNADSNVVGEGHIEGSRDDDGGAFSDSSLDEIFSSLATYTPPSAEKQVDEVQEEAGKGRRRKQSPAKGKSKAQSPRPRMKRSRSGSGSPVSNAGRGYSLLQQLLRELTDDEEPISDDHSNQGDDEESMKDGAGKTGVENVVRKKPQVFGSHLNAVTRADSIQLAKNRVGLKHNASAITETNAGSLSAVTDMRMSSPLARSTNEKDVTTTAAHSPDQKAVAGAHRRHGHGVSGVSKRESAKIEILERLMHTSRSRVHHLKTALTTLQETNRSLQAQLEETNRRLREANDGKPGFINAADFLPRRRAEVKMIVEAVKLLVGSANVSVDEEKVNLADDPAPEACEMAVMSTETRKADAEDGLLESMRKVSKDLYSFLRSNYTSMETAVSRDVSDDDRPLRLMLPPPTLSEEKEADEPMQYRKHDELGSFPLDFATNAFLFHDMAYCIRILETALLRAYRIMRHMESLIELIMGSGQAMQQMSNDVPYQSSSRARLFEMLGSVPITGTASNAEAQSVTSGEGDRVQKILRSLQSVKAELSQLEQQLPEEEGTGNIPKSSSPLPITSSLSSTSSSSSTSQTKKRVPGLEGVQQSAVSALYHSKKKEYKELVKELMRAKMMDGLGRGVPSSIPSSAASSASASPSRSKGSEESSLGQGLRPGSGSLTQQSSSATIIGDDEPPQADMSQPALSEQRTDLMAVKEKHSVTDPRYAGTEENERVVVVSSISGEDANVEVNPAKIDIHAGTAEASPAVSTVLLAKLKKMNSNIAEMKTAFKKEKPVVESSQS
ncbi:Ankyrin repeat domain-containing protein 22 [Quaeritorhiza haematococci]|nr:Ankyrin repeat domain-containing protein 22 [Quaeritorhiza haematococci]